MAKKESYNGRSKEDLQNQYLELCKRLFMLRNEKRMNGRLEKPHQLREARREIARILTALSGQ